MVDAEVLLQAYHYLSSAIAQAFAALIAPLIPPNEWLWLPRGVETALVVVALGFTVRAVIKMLKEPEEEAKQEQTQVFTLIYGSGIMRAKLNALYKHATQGEACLSVGYVEVAAR